MVISTIITSYDQHLLTVVHVREAMESTRTPDEIIVVNDGGDDSLEQMLADLPKRCPIIYAKVTKDIPWNQCGARNLGIFLSRGDYICLEDNDHIPTRSFYEEAEKLLEQGYDKVSPKIRKVVGKEYILSKPMNEWSVHKTRGIAKIISVCKREFLLDIKGFDEQFCGRYGWDVPDFVDRANRRGIKEIAYGAYYVVGDWLSNEEKRVFYGKEKKSWATKMSSVNYHHRRRNVRENRIMSMLGIMSFDYLVKRYEC